MNEPLKKQNANWPTLAGRLSQPLTTRPEAVRQLKQTMPLTPLAETYLDEPTTEFDMDSGNVRFDEMQATCDVAHFDELPQFERIKKHRKPKK